MRKRLWAAILSLVMTISLLPTTALAANNSGVWAKEYNQIRIYLDEETKKDLKDLDGTFREVRIISSKYTETDGDGNGMRLCGFWDGYWWTANRLAGVTANDIISIDLARDKAIGHSPKISIPIEGDTTYKVTVSEGKGGKYLRIDITKRTPHTVKYEFSGTADVDYPSSVTLPEDKNTYTETSVVELKQLKRTTMTGKKDGQDGTWTFNGWQQPEGVTFTDNNTKFTMPDTDVTVTGTWTFEATPPTSVYVYFRTVDSADNNIDNVEGVTYNDDTTDPSRRWATLGKLETKTSVTDSVYETLGQEVVAQTGFDYYVDGNGDDNNDFPLDLITWEKVSTHNGAPDYVPVGTDVWHLDGKVTAYRVVYCDNDGTELANFAPNTAPTYYLKNAANVSLTSVTPVSGDLSKQFLGWSTAQGATAPDDSITVSFASGDMKVYAVWGSKTPAALTVTKVVETSDGTTIPENALPSRFEFHFDSDEYTEKYLYNLNTSRQSDEEWKWGPATYVEGYYDGASTYTTMPLYVGQKWRFSEPYSNVQGSEINCIDGYDLIETETKYYVNDTEMTPDAAGAIDIELQEETNIRVVNTYRKITEDIYANGALSFRHQVEGFNTCETSNTEPHKATKQNPTIDYQVELDLSKLTLSGGKNFKEVVEPKLGNGGKKLTGSLLIEFRFNENEVQKLSGREVLELCDRLEQEGFETIGTPSTISYGGKWGVDIELAIDMTAWTEKITISGLQLHLAEKLTDQDTDKNPRTITAEVRLYGENIKIEEDPEAQVASAAVSVQEAPEEVVPVDNLTLYGEATNTAKLYWKETGKDDKDDDKDPKYTLTLTKVDAETGSPLPGAKFELYQVGKKSDTLIGQSRYQTTDKNGKLSVSVSDSGEYYWVEIQPPQGYTIDKSEHYTDTGRNSSITVTNQKTGTPSQLTDDHFAYVIGYQDGTVRPYGLISRAETTTIFFRLLKDEVRDSNLRTSNTFKDVSDDYWANTAISTMTGLGIVTGRSADTFDPRAPITRAQFAAICARFDTGVRTGSTKFTDTEGHWAQAYIERAADLGWVQGFEDGSFRPDTYITRAQAMTMINRVLSRLPYDADDLSDGMNEWPDCTPSDWFYLAVQEATNSHNYTYTKHSNAGVYETWTKLKADPDWTRYEH